MRIPIAVRIEPFDVEQLQPQIDAARRAFARYLDEVPRKSTSSKHGLMGPVGKILSQVKSGRRDAPSLKGYSLRVHEANGRGRGRGPSSTSLQALEEGVDHLLDLLDEAPVVAHDRLLDRLDYGLYFDLRKKAFESREARREAWIGFLRQKYGGEAGLDLVALSAAWDAPVASIKELYLPRMAEGARGSRATARAHDIAAFWESQGATLVIEEEDEE